MGDRCYFIQFDIDCQRLEDFLRLPYGNQFRDAYSRHMAAFIASR